MDGIDPSLDRDANDVVDVQIRADRRLEPTDQERLVCLVPSKKEEEEEEEEEESVRAARGCTGL